MRSWILIGAFSLVGLLVSEASGQCVNGRCRSVAKVVQRFAPIQLSMHSMPEPIPDPLPNAVIVGEAIIVAPQATVQRAVASTTSSRFGTGSRSVASSRNVLAHTPIPSGFRHQGVGFSTRSARDAMRNACFWNSGWARSIKVTRAANGWKAEANYR